MKNTISEIKMSLGGIYRLAIANERLVFKPEEQRIKLFKKGEQEQRYSPPQETDQQFNICLN